MDVVEIHILMFRAVIRFVDSLFKLHASQQRRHEQQLSSFGLRRQVLRSRGISRSLYLSQSRSGPGVRIHFVDDGELQFLSEFVEFSSFVASDKGVVFFDTVDQCLQRVLEVRA